MIPISVAHPLANQVGNQIPAALVEPRAARTPTTPLGKMASPAVLMARNNAMALVAVPFSVLYLSSSSTALIPKGVAAFPSPSMFAEIFKTMALMAGLPAGIDGKRSRMSGLTRRERLAVSPAFCATFMRPRKKAMTPTRPMARSTAERADVSMTSDTSCIRPV